MKYYEWKGRFVDTAKQMIWKGVTKFENDIIDFSLGEHIADEVQNTKFIIDWHPERSQMGYLTDYMRVGGIFGIIMTSKSVEILRQAGATNIQVFDLEIIDEKHNKTYTDYKIINIVGLCDCLDYDKSDIDYYKDRKIMMIDEIAVDESKVPEDLLIFRLEKFKPIVIIHEKVKYAIEKAGLTGFVIEPTH